MWMMKRRPPKPASKNPFIIQKGCMKKVVLIVAFLIIHYKCYCWGFYDHKKINYHAVFLLPPEMMVLYKLNIDFLPISDF